MMRINKLKNKLKSGEIVLGTWSNIPSPGVANIISNTGMDFIVIDMGTGQHHIFLENQVMQLRAMVPLQSLGSVI